MALFDPTWSVSTSTKMANDAGTKGQTQWDTLAGQNADNWNTAKTVSNQALDTSRGFNDWSLDKLKSTSAMYDPAKKLQLDTALNWASPTHKEALRSMAMGSQAQAGAAAKDNWLRQLESFGIDPGAARYQALDRTAGNQTAAAEAAAGTMSDLTADVTGQGLIAQAINTGQQDTGQAMAGAGVGLAAGNQAVNAPLAATGVQASTMGTPVQWAAQQTQNHNAAVQAMVNSAQIQAQNEQQAASSSSGVGALIGAGMGMLGSIFGGPVGGMAGSMIGGMFGGSGGGQVGGYTLASATGGMIPALAEGGEVPSVGQNMIPQSASPSGGAQVDDVTAKVTPGEFVWPVDVVAWRGEAWMQKEIEKARQERAQKTVAKPQMKEMPAALATGAPSYVSEGAAA